MIFKKALVSLLAILLLAGVLSACSSKNADRYAGHWVINIIPQSFSREECRNSFLGQPVIMAFDITPNGSEVNGIPVDDLGSGAIHMNAGWRLFGGVMSNDEIDFTIWLPNDASPDGCGDTNQFSGKVSGSRTQVSSISGTYVGGDCISQYAMVSSSLDEENACTWSGTFTVSISP